MVSAIERHADVLALGIDSGIAVEFHVAGLKGENCVVAAHAAVVAGKPVRAALAEDDVARDDVLIWNLRNVSRWVESKTWKELWLV